MNLVNRPMTLPSLSADAIRNLRVSGSSRIASEPGHTPIGIPLPAISHLWLKKNPYDQG